MVTNTPFIDRKALRGFMLSVASQKHGAGRITRVSFEALERLNRVVEAEARKMALYRDGVSKTIRPIPVAIEAPPKRRRK